MAVTTTTTAGITSVIFTYKAATAQLTRIADKAANILYDEGFGNHAKLYTQLTNAEKLSILDQFILKSLMNKVFTQAAREGETAKNGIIEAAKLESPLT